jgi:hypothetical protein
MLVCGAATGLALLRGWGKDVLPTAPPTPLASVPPPVDSTVTPTAVASPDASPEAHAATPAPAPQPQVNIAILVLDSLSSPTPVLQAVWIAALQPERQTAFLLGLSPYSWVRLDAGGEVRLRDTYIFDPATGTGGPGFEKALAEIAAVPTAGSVTVDAPLLAEIVNRLGGVDLAGTRMDGAGSAAFALAASPGDPLGQSANQMEFVSALRDTSAISLMDLLPYLDLVIQQGRSDLPPETLYALGAAYQGFNPAALGIAPPVPDPQLVFVAADGQPAVLLPAYAGAATNGD